MHATRTRRSPSNPALRHTLALAFGAAPALPALLYCLACYYLPRAARALGWATGPVPAYGAAAARARSLRAGPQAAAALYAPAAPCVAVPYANVPVAALAPVPLLAYTPAAAPAKGKAAPRARKARKPAPVPMAHAAQRTVAPNLHLPAPAGAPAGAVGQCKRCGRLYGGPAAQTLCNGMVCYGKPAAPRCTAVTAKGKPGAGPKGVSVYVKVGNRYVCRAPRAGQQAYRRVPHGKAWRYLPM